MLLLQAYKVEVKAYISPLRPPLVLLVFPILTEY